MSAYCFSPLFTACFIIFAFLGLFFAYVLLENLLLDIIYSNISDFFDLLCQADSGMSSSSWAARVCLGGSGRTVILWRRSSLLVFFIIIPKAWR